MTQPTDLLQYESLNLSLLFASYLFAVVSLYLSSSPRHLYWKGVIQLAYDDAIKLAEKLVEKRIVACAQASPSGQGGPFLTLLGKERRTER